MLARTMHVRAVARGHAVGPHAAQRRVPPSVDKDGRSRARVCIICHVHGIMAEGEYASHAAQPSRVIIHHQQFVVTRLTRHGTRRRYTLRSLLAVERIAEPFRERVARAVDVERRGTMGKAGVVDRARLQRAGALGVRCAEQCEQASPAR